MTNLTILEKNLPLRAYPEESLNNGILALYDWLCGLLSLTGENSKERLKNAFPAIKEQCIGMGFSEIKKMFEMYADGKLDIEPVTNYFDRVLLGKIVKSYRSYMNRTKTTVSVIEAKKQKDNKEIIFYFEEYRDKKQSYDGWQWVYSYFESKGLLKPTNAEKIHYFSKYKKILKTEEAVVKMCKLSLVRDYFETLINKGKHVKIILDNIDKREI